MSYIARWSRYTSTGDKIKTVEESPRYRRYESAEAWVQGLPGFMKITLDNSATDDPTTLALWRRDRGSLSNKTAVIDFVAINRVDD